LLVVFSATSALAAPNCQVPHFRTLENQTVTGYMTVKSGKSCAIILRSSAGPMYGAHIIARPANGSVRIDAGNRVVYQPRRGFTGNDSFTYARSGLDARNNPTVRTVQIAVEVAP